MADETTIAQSKTAFETLCRMLDNNGWNYRKDEEKLTVTATARGEDLPIDLYITIQAESNIVKIISKLPFEIQEDKRLDVAMAVTYVNNMLVMGNFDFNITDGRLYFRVSNSFADSTPSEELFHWLLMCACLAVDKHNDTLLMVAKGMLSLEQFIASCGK